ncbi:hypothetical protein M378DRAFT_9694 [Amanita muscaria Koide BX008]|uniref:Uncharacterized protein n=1 Tax=Amanita muscaria (strain Koide BX008) TaxID=946122 RepID=A0A0C2SUF9_AMAMK|nr:hypothetical protein M378DRAFT_9694 [Amanita muscaria Koide BX008]
MSFSSSLTSRTPPLTSVYLRRLLKSPLTTPTAPAALTPMPRTALTAAAASTEGALPVLTASVFRIPHPVVLWSLSAVPDGC